MPRDIVVNGRFLARRVTGNERYGREILRRFKNEHRVEQTRTQGILGHAWEQFILPTKLKRDSILWSPANSGPLAIQNQALTIHDLSPLEHPEWFTRSYSAWYCLFLPMLAKRVRVIFTPSEYVKQKVIRRFGVENVIVTPNGVDTSVFRPETKQGVIDFPKKYVLFVGSLQPRKNLEGLMRAWHRVKGKFADTWLVVAGDSGYVFRSVKFFADERIRFLNYVADENLPGLYANAELFVLPSFDEGFGLPALEAMACRTPVIVSDGGALPETVGEAGLVFHLEEPDSLAQTMEKCLSDERLRASLIEKGLARVKMFSWQNTADLIWKTLNEL
ncbi:MAG: D-inositol-3-phosphate glycosyltransferase [Anaerolineales bacterium]|nr:D-inositol-3-phosphate glycosyltransferase [Anaerolineales bacterium]